MPRATWNDDVVGGEVGFGYGFVRFLAAYVEIRVTVKLKRRRARLSREVARDD
jgi:hypothetical protein